jgi:hypothetical protein
MMGKMDFIVVIWLFNSVFIGLCCLTTYNTCAVILHCYQYVSNRIATIKKYDQEMVSWAKYVIKIQDETNMINYITGKEICNEFLHNIMIDYPKKEK